MTCDLLSERNIALLLSSGKLVFLELGKIGESNEFTLNQLFGPSTDELTVLPPLRLLVTGLMSSVASQPTTIKMCPPLTSKNRHFYKPLMAAGTQSGLIQIYNMAWASVEKEFSLHAYPVRGIEWISLSSFISYAYSSSNSQVKNEMFITDVNTGYTNQIRKDHGEENPIEIVRVSPLKQYFVIVMKDGPFELWDLKTLTLMRSMPKKFPLVTALEWSPAHNFKLLKTKKKSVSEDPSKAESPAGEAGASSPQTTQQVVAREHFVFTDTESLLYHFTLEGIFVKDVIKMPPEMGMSQITSIAYKSSQIIQGDSDGSL
ncbi:WD repeat-containing protein 11-like, partial [Nilaparvata lugens]|uniref:WD repeat-containing protein 11-like n=1 Tax=Nilaparvata lugens TaxID=108931 RepID=UPI00193E1236